MNQHDYYVEDISQQMKENFNLQKKVRISHSSRAQNFKQFLFLLILSFSLNLFGAFSTDGQTDLTDSMLLFLVFYAIISQYLSLFLVVMDVRRRIINFLDRSLRKTSPLVEVKE
jgi:hypothetical protein